MGSLFVQIGQCGCQIGAKLNPLISNSYYCTRNRPPNRLHTIMIDTEPKVLQKYIQKEPKWLDLDNIKYFQHGRGNNWSYGYLHEIPQQKLNIGIMSEYKQFSHKKQNQVIHQYIEQNKKISHFVVQKVRKQLETVDCALAINVISSLGGGTGSGLGTQTIEILSQEFNIDIYAHSVLPNMSGQTPLQIYNCLLSLSVIQQFASAIFPIQNQKCLEYFREKNTQYFQIESLDQINQYIGSRIAKLCKINDIEGYDKFYTDIISSHVLSPQLKYLNLITTQSISQVQPWEECHSDLLDQIKIFNKDFSNEIQSSKRQTLLSGQIISIGKQPMEYDKKYKKKIQNALNLYQTQLQLSEIIGKGTHTNSLIKQKLQKKEKNNLKQKHQLILIMNHTNITRYLSYLCQRGRQKFDNKAYLWHYQYVDIQQALQNVQKCVDQYNFFTQ